jgi:glycosyltransferase involved in cell wall biosynthesis
MKKKISILGAQTHFKLRIDKKTGKEICYIGAVDYYRVIQQLKYLPKNEFDVDIMYELVGGISPYKTTDELTKHYDICFFSYMDSVPFYIDLKVNGIKNGMKMVMDLDDNIWAVDPSHPYYKDDFEPGSEKGFNRSAIILDADAVTTTNRFLKYQIVGNTQRNIKDIKILPNFIDLTLFDYKKIPPRPDTKEIQIGYLGGASHFPDINKPEFLKAMHVIMDKYPNVRLKTTFYMPQLKAEFGYKYKYCLGRFNYFRYVKEVWPKMMSESDITIAPLSWSKYSRAKSYVKYLEMAAGKKPMVCENIDPYKEVLDGHIERGFLVSSTEEWVSALSKLIESKDLRKSIGDAAYEYVKENHTIQNPKNVELMANYFRDLTNK